MAYGVFTAVENSRTLRLNTGCRSKLIYLEFLNREILYQSEIVKPPGSNVGFGMTFYDK